MSTDKILVALLSLLGMAFTFWFFLMKKDAVVTASEAINIIVEGGYSPSVISIPKNKKMKITFLRKDSSSCLEEVVVSEFKIRRFLPLNKKVSIEITPKREGTFPFSCGMSMFHGKIIVT